MSDPTPPTVDPLVVDVDDLARRLKLETPLDGDTADVLEQAILDAQADVEGYLGRPVVPTPVTETGLWPWPEGWQLTDDCVLSVVSATAETDPDSGLAIGTYTVTYLAGLDVRNDPALRPIRRFVLAHAENLPPVVDVWREQTRARGPITNLSTDGQSASFAAPTRGGGGNPGTGAPGALPSLESLYPWKRGAVFQRRGFTVLGTVPWWW